MKKDKILQMARLLLTPLVMVLLGLLLLGKQIGTQREK